ncbi:MAG: hypothetical protein WA294_15945 [Acidobacteriaceae bacterium]
MSIDLQISPRPMASMLGISLTDILKEIQTRKRERASSLLPRFATLTAHLTLYEQVLTIPVSSEGLNCFPVSLEIVAGADQRRNLRISVGSMPRSNSM